MALYKELHSMKEELKKLEASTPTNWLGRWAKQIRLQSLKSRILIIEGKIEECRSRKK